MFTGLIEEVGAVSKRTAAHFTIMAKQILDGLKPGDSVAVNGACLTVTMIQEDAFVVKTSPETLARTTLGRLRPGHAVNLERAMAVGDRFGGHFVLGHVDGVGQVESIHPQGEFSLWRFRAPSSVACYIIPKGSVAIDGISLTVVEPAADTFGVAIIPTTLELTTLGKKRPGDAVNLEADVIGKHVYHYVSGLSDRSGTTREGLSRDFLARYGFD